MSHTQSRREYKGYIIKLKYETLGANGFQIIKRFTVKEFILHECYYNFILPADAITKAKNYIDNFREKLEEKQLKKWEEYKLRVSKNPKNFPENIVKFMNTDEFKNDLRLVIDQNPQPIKFVINYTSPKTPKESFETKKQFGLRLLEILADPETDNVDVQIVKLKGYIGDYKSMKGICDWHRFSMTQEKAAKPVIQKNIEELQFLVTTKADVISEQERIRNMSTEQYFYKNTK